MISSFLTVFGRSPLASPWATEDSICAELFSVERLEQHAESLAAAQAVTASPIARQSLGSRLKDNEAVLLAAYRQLGSTTRDGQVATPAAEWLLDNYHLVEEQIREVRDDLPPRFYRQLPKLAEGPLAGYPRVLGLTWAFVAHTDSRFEPDMLCRFVRAYQRVQPLTIGELWAVAITLRIVLVENLRRAAKRIVSSRTQREAADDVADRLLGVNGQTTESVDIALRDYQSAPLPKTFAVQLVQRLRDQDPRVTPALVWLETRLAAQGTTTDELVHSEHQRQGAASVTVRNIITSMRMASAVDWTELFESTSLVDELLRTGSDFASMDFSTRNLYRSAIEALGRSSQLTELDITRTALRLAADTADQESRAHDPGYHLISHGRPDFEKTIGYRAPLRSWLARCNTKIGVGGYIAGVILVAAAALFGALLTLRTGGWQLGLLAILGIIPATDLAVALVNRAVMAIFGATILPGLALRDGIPPNLRTIVAVPTMLTTPKSIDEQIEHLEIHFLASPDGDLHFALLSDWLDASAEHVEGDDALLAEAAKGIDRLNAQYGPAPGGKRFLLLHRRRVWNDSEQRWIGWERKRGKLHELNRLLRGATDTTFVTIAGQPAAVPPDVRYVITLDADTRLPRDTVRKLIGKMAHPLNRPRIDVAAGRVVEGYAVLQPRVTPSLPVGREGSLFQRIYSSMSGIDPYASAVSDVYQDLFGEGSYAGKGIYDVDAFETTLHDRVPPNTLLSHDLFEGTFARAGLASDAEVVEEYPARYDVAVARQHRWARGDWQLLPWIFGRNGASHDQSSKRGLPLIGRWKMLDNLRRTLSAPASVLALLIAWTLAEHDAALWTFFILSTIAVPTLLPAIAAVVPRRARITARSHLDALGGDIGLALTQTAMTVTLLAHQAWSMSDAIGRTLFRLFVSHRHLLEWVTAAGAKSRPRLDLPGAYRQMAGSVVLGAASVLVVGLAGGDAAPIAVSFALLWVAAPAIARWSSISPQVAGHIPVSAADARDLRLIARRTWRFFETFVSADDHMLPPDNFQEDPKPVLARRTSPTNMGLYLLSAVSARDFGWMGTIETVERLEATLATMATLPRFRGHFYNWYDTSDMRPLEPQYVSTVDSGNLAGHLIAIANACREWIDEPVAPARLLSGIEDALRLARDAIAEFPGDFGTESVTRQELDNALGAVDAAMVSASDLPAQLKDLARLAAVVIDITQTQASGDEPGSEMLFWARAARRSIESHQRDAVQTAAHARLTNLRLLALETTARAMADAMEFDFLLDPHRRLLSIGYLIAEGRLDESCYDLLASEARLASFVAIAKGDVPSRHWFRLGRAVTPIEHGAALVSWSGSMFEYLMPSLVMRAPAGSLLDETNRLIVHRQISFGHERKLPWGISESAYNARDLEFTYQYSNFGVPGLGLKRGLGLNAVVAPYATALATMVDPAAAMRNFARLAQAGARGRYGFCEALDYTRSRLPDEKDCAVIRAYMAHHQGMTIVAIANALMDGKMRARFHAEPSIQATELLLQERTPRDVMAARPWAEDSNTSVAVRVFDRPTARRIRSPHGPTPAVHLLSNGRYAVMLTAAGSGYSRWRDIAITRWREDSTCDDWGSYVFLRDVKSGNVWSAGYQPTRVAPDRADVRFSEDKGEYTRRDGTITTILEVVVSSEHDSEVRRVSIFNAGPRPREIEVTSYAELVLAQPAADTAHPAFSKLFVQTEYDARTEVILATRRRRSPAEPEVWAAHLAIVEGETVGETEIETDRAKFLGRGHDAMAPVSITGKRPLSGSVGTVLDPVFALRRRVRVQPGETVRVAFWTIVAPSRSGVLGLTDKHQDASAFDRAATLAWTQAQVQLRHLDIDAEEASLFQRLAGHVLYVSPSMRPAADIIRRGSGGPAGLWAQSISGDIPIVLVRIDDIEDIAIVGQLLRAHEYWRMKGLAVDLVILNERSSSYVQDLHIAIETMVRKSQARHQTGADSTRGGVFVLRADLIAQETRALLPSVARVVLSARQGSLQDQLDRLRHASITAPPPARRAILADAPTPTPAMPELAFFNGLGGFTADGREYVTVLNADQFTPAPWINVIANEAFGFQVAAEGSGYTWSVNSKENQLTPWSNDPVTDQPGEVIFVRDEDSGALWGPTALPTRDRTAPHIARHGQGYSRFEHEAHGIKLDLLQFVPLHDPIKISRLKIRNTSTRTRRLSLTAYVEWVLGPSRAAAAPFIVTEIDPATGALFARNPWSTAFGGRVAFVDMAGRQTRWTGDRREFLGRNGSLDNPAALAANAPNLSGRIGAGLDPCGVLQAPLTLAPGGEAEIVFFLGEAASTADAQFLLAHYRAVDLDATFRDVLQHWESVLGAVQVKTPDAAMDIMLNRWLLYQTLACRLWARSAFYQASGAYGFRDQIQDGMALALTQPAMIREHLLRAAARQFAEGDVQHWWLPPFGQGVRTRISDDRIWLAYATAHYIETTGDLSVLDEEVPFIEGQSLRPEEADAFFQPTVSSQTVSLFEHCARGLDHSLAVGAHGLPLIGTGDWNDGMTRVGDQGKGESVWLGWFLYTTLMAFAPLAEARNASDRVTMWSAHNKALQTALERDGWDGNWYRRAFFDDGTPLGSSVNGECRIDSIAQSWSAISGAADPGRAVQAMAAADEQLVQHDAGLALIFTPPFDRTPLDPGYVKGYPPGIRENGGQYTHASAWSVIAYAKLGDGNRAHELFALLNPINHASTRARVHRYKVEPYVVAADIYSEPPHVGRGGWTWYTGSAGWMYRAGVESILGLRRQGAFLILDPCIPKHWPGFELTYRNGNTRYEIAVENPNGVSRGVISAEFDGQPITNRPMRLLLTDDGKAHRIHAVLG